MPQELLYWIDREKLDFVSLLGNSASKNPKIFQEIVFK
jgi:hypothetical protein